MFSKLLRKRLTYANVTATLALVFAMTGGALAAKHYLITSTNQISPKVLKSLQGKAGAAGAPGAQGPSGAAGPAGGKGDTGAPGSGAEGKEGKEGTEGKAGASVTSKEFSSAKGSCKEGGSEFAVEKKAATYACNGQPWTPNNTLPAGAAETGTWGFNALAQATLGTTLVVPISFPIPLSAPLSAGHVHIFEGTGTPPNGCSDTVAGEAITNLKAEPGNLCIYERVGEEVTAAQLTTLNVESNLENPGEAGRTGAMLTNTTQFKAGALAVGIWAVTAE